MSKQADSFVGRLAVSISQVDVDGERFKSAMSAELTKHLLDDDENDDAGLASTLLVASDSPAWCASLTRHTLDFSPPSGPPLPPLGWLARRFRNV